MTKYLKEQRLLKTDEAWLAVDKDIWIDSQLQELHQWPQEAQNHGFALSNPSFEYWLLLHFEDGNPACMYRMIGASHHGSRLTWACAGICLLLLLRKTTSA
jgi:hypothetical protein